MTQVTEFFRKIFETADWPPRWHCGNWTEFHGWLYIISDLLIWSAYFSIPLVIIRYIAKKPDLKFVRLYFLFAAFILACGATHFLDVVIFWVPLYRLSALLKFVTGILSWITVFYLVKNLPVIASLKPQKQLELEIEQRKKAESELYILNIRLEEKIKERTEALEKSEERFRAIIEQYPSPVVRFDTNGEFIMANPQWEMMWNDKRENAIGYNILSDPLLNALPLAENIKDAFAGKVSRSATYELDPKLIGKSGRKRWLEMLLFPIKDNNGKIQEVISVNIDVTDRKNAEEKNLLFASIVNSTLDAILSKDLNGTITSWNYGAEKLFGYAAQEIIGKNISTIIPAHLQEEEKMIIEKIKSGEQVDHYETERIRKDGTIVEVSLTISPIKDSAGNITGASKILNDISEKKAIENKLKQSEKIYKTIASSIPGSVICLLDKDYSYQLIEGDMLEKLGYSKQNLIGNKIANVVSAEYFATIEKDLQSALKGETITRESTINGYDVMTRFIPLLDENNIVYAMMTVTIDVTQLKSAQHNIIELNRNLEEKIVRRTEELKKSNEELEAFSYSVSHDLRTPLRAINGYARILEEDYNATFDEEGKRLLNEVQLNAAKMGALIDDLLSFSRLGKKNTEKSLVDMNNLSKLAVKECSSLLTDKTTIKIWPLLSVKADPSLMLQVMTNLVSNAIKYSSKRDNPIIEIKSKRGNKEIIYWISDNGAGFNMEYAHKLFGVFQRLHSADEFPGTGVGLAIVQRIIQKQNGKVWAEGKEGLGATFYFSLPEIL
jgi:PAS domain S-box-containing protein